MANREKLEAILAGLTGDDIYTEDELKSMRFLASASLLGSTDLPQILDLAEIDPALGALYNERALQGHIFDESGLRGRYQGEDGGLGFLMDSQVLQGLIERSIRDDGEVMYRLSPQGIRYVEDELLPEIAREEGS